MRAGALKNVLTGSCKNYRRARASAQTSFILHRQRSARIARSYGGVHIIDTSLLRENVSVDRKAKPRKPGGEKRDGKKKRKKRALRFARGISNERMEAHWHGRMRS